MSEIATLENSIYRGLACAALHAGLRTVLLIDATPRQVIHLRDVLLQMLAAVAPNTDSTPAQIKSSTLGPTDTEDSLWGVPFLPDAHGTTRFIQPGHLRNAALTSPELHMLVIPDLTNLSLPAERAIVMAAGTDLVHLERHGQHERWQPDLCWLAAIQQADMGKVSPHMLDRFAVRIHVQPEGNERESVRIAQLLTRLDSPSVNPTDSVTLAQPLIEQLLVAQEIEPIFTDEAARQIFVYLPSMGFHSTVRDLVLARLAVAEAILQGNSEVNAEHIDNAAHMLGLRAAKLESEQSSVPDLAAELDNQLLEPEQSHGDETLKPISTPTTQRDNQPSPQYKEVSVDEPDTTKTLPSTPMPANQPKPYGEDIAIPERDPAPLQLPVRNVNSSGTHGPAIGVERSQSLQDLALTATIFQAIKYQSLRHSSPSDHCHLHISSNDLRRYRRLPLPQQMLVMLLDYTAIQDFDWENALLRHFEWAYTERARVTLVLVGAKDTRHELRAELKQGRNLLDPIIGRGLDSTPGTATPLAHGIELSSQVLKKSLQHGRTSMGNARLVVLTDGRGNVPLEASRTGEILLPVGTKGIQDALLAANEINQMERVTTFVINPNPYPYPELPIALAGAFGCVIEPQSEQVEYLANRILEEVLL